MASPFSVYNIAYLEIGFRFSFLISRESRTAIIDIKLALKNKKIKNILQIIIHTGILVESIFLNFQSCL